MKKSILLFVILLLGSTTFLSAQEVKSSAHSTYFGYNSAILTAEGKSTLDNLIARLKKGSEYEVLVYGYTDQSGGDDYNMKLSSRRINSVADYLIAQGIKSELVKRQIPRGKGSPSKYTVNDPTRTADKSRQVELIVTPKIDIIDPSGAPKSEN